MHTRGDNSMARKVGLTLEDVIDAAMAVADTEGLDAVTLASVALLLGVRSPSLYAHVDGADGLKRVIAIRAAGELGAVLADAVAGRHVGGADALREVAHVYRRFALEHPGLYLAAQRATDPQSDPELYAALLAAAQPVLRALEEAGVRTVADRVHFTRVFRSALHGFVSLERLGGFGLPQDIDESFDRLVEGHITLLTLLTTRS